MRIPNLCRSNFDGSVLRIGVGEICRFLRYSRTGNVVQGIVLGAKFVRIPQWIPSNPFPSI
jgi:hypothetical protein